MPLGDDELRDLLLSEAGVGIDPDAKDEATQRADSLWQYWTGLKGTGRLRDLEFQRSVLKIMLGTVQHLTEQQTMNGTLYWNQRAEMLLKRITDVGAEILKREQEERGNRSAAVGQITKTAPRMVPPGSFPNPNSDRLRGSPFCGPFGFW